MVSSGQAQVRHARTDTPAGASRPPPRSGSTGGNGKQRLPVLMLPTGAFRPGNETARVLKLTPDAGHERLGGVPGHAGHAASSSRRMREGKE